MGDGLSSIPQAYTPMSLLPRLFDCRDLAGLAVTRSARDCYGTAGFSLRGIATAFQLTRPFGGSQ